MVRIRNVRCRATDRSYLETEAVAEVIHQEVRGDMMGVKPGEPHPDDYDAIVAQVDEETEPGYTPSLKAKCILGPLFRV